MPLGGAMSGDDDLETGRKTPPEAHEWQGIWAALERANKGWVITAPIYAVVSNWKALALAATVVLMLNGARILEILEAYLGKLP